MSKQDSVELTLMDVVREQAELQRLAGPSAGVEDSIIGHVPQVELEHAGLMDAKSGAMTPVGGKLLDLVSSDDFLQKLSDELGAPKPDETRAQFIERGKELLRRLLKSALGR